MYPKQKTPSVSLGGADLSWGCNGALSEVSWVDSLNLKIHVWTSVSKGL